MKLKTDKQTTWGEEIGFVQYDESFTHMFRATRWKSHGNDYVWTFEVTLSYKHNKPVHGLICFGSDPGRELPMKLSRQFAKAFDTPRKRRLAAVLKVVNSIKENP